MPYRRNAMDEELEEHGGVEADPRVETRIDRVVIASGIVAAALAIALVLPDLLRPGPRVETPARSRIAVAGDVTSGAHRGDRCTLDIEIVRGECRLDVTVVCPTIERRFSTKRCIAPGAPISARTDDFDLDGARGRLVFERGTVEVQLDAWR